MRAGEFYLLLGPNGAGKTTTLRMVSGLLKPDAGAISIFGIDALADPVAAKQITGWLSDEPMIYDKLTPPEYLEFVAGLWNVRACCRRRAVARICCAGWIWSPMRGNAAKAFRAACARKWRWPARWCMSRA